VAISDDNEILLRGRAEDGLLGGMAEVPTTAWTARRDGGTEVGDAPFHADWLAAGTVIHVFTHFELRLAVYRAPAGAKTNARDGWWTKVENLSGEALPTVMKKAIAAAIPEAFAKKRKHA